MKKKLIVMLLSLVTTIMAINAAGGSGAAFATTNTTTADPMHCDKPGYPSCYSIGFQAGKNARFGTACPTDHNKSYCTGYEAGNRSGGSISNNGGARGTIGSSESDKIKGSDSSTSTRSS
jgi:hypothetical protein